VRGVGTTPRRTPSSPSRGRMQSPAPTSLLAPHVSRLTSHVLSLTSHFSRLTSHLKLLACHFLGVPCPPTSSCRSPSAIPLPTSATSSWRRERSRPTADATSSAADRPPSWKAAGSPLDWWCSSFPMPNGHAPGGTLRSTHPGRPCGRPAPRRRCSWWRGCRQEVLPEDAGHHRRHRTARPLIPARRSLLWTIVHPRWSHSGAGGRCLGPDRGAHR
jgi:hypothetical protein